MVLLHVVEVEVVVSNCVFLPKVVAKVAGRLLPPLLRFFSPLLPLLDLKSFHFLLVCAQLFFPQFSPQNAPSQLPSRFYDHPRD